MDKVLLITGGARGIGRETARLAAKEDYKIAVNYRERSDAADALCQELAEHDAEAIAIQADVANEDEIIRLFNETEHQLGKLTHLVCSAGIGHPARVEEIDLGKLRHMFEVNVFGLMLCCREAARRMSTKNGGHGGSIVTISSMAATVGGRDGASTYASSKGAVDVFTTGFAREVAGEGIRVNAVRPGMTMTDMTARVRDNPDRKAMIGGTIPMGRVGEPQEIAEVVLFLLSDKASFVTNTHVNVGGGGFNVGPR